MSTILKKLGFGVISAFIFGMSGCYMDDQRPQTTDYSAANTTAANAQHQAKAVRKSSSSDVAQKTTPGPKHTAAPQIPVIQ